MYPDLSFNIHTISIFFVFVFLQKRPNQRLLSTALHSTCSHSFLQLLRRVKPALPICRVLVDSASQHAYYTAKRCYCQREWKSSTLHPQQVKDGDNIKSQSYSDKSFRFYKFSCICKFYSSVI